MEIIPRVQWKTEVTAQLVLPMALLGISEEQIGKERFQTEQWDDFSYIYKEKRGSVGKV